jgi:hypothetical protein
MLERLQKNQVSLVRDVAPLVSQLYVVIGSAFFVGPGEQLSLASVSTKHFLLSFPSLILLLGE